MFLLFEPLAGWRQTRSRSADTETIRPRLARLSDGRYARADRVVLVQDNLNTHSRIALRGLSADRGATSRPATSSSTTRPKHGSWLNLAEFELAVLASQCLDRRIPDKQILKDEIAAWEHDRNAHHTKSDWQFTTKDARVKLKHLYPAI